MRHDNLLKMWLKFMLNWLQKLFRIKISSFTRHDAQTNMLVPVKSIAGIRFQQSSWFIQVQYIFNINILHRELKFL